MTRQQRRVLLIMQDYRDRGSYARVEDVATSLGVQKGNTCRMMRRLQDAGYIGRKKYEHHYEILRRIEPIVDVYVWNDATKSLVRWSYAEAADVG